MRYLNLAVLLISTCSPTFALQGSVPRKSLRLSAEILSQRLCVGSADVDFLRLDLRLRFTNVGDRRLILYRGNNLFFTVWVNSHPAQPSASQYELKTSTALFKTTNSEDIDKPAPNKDFVVLPPGAKYETGVTVSLPVACERCGHINGAITSGEHLLRLTTSTWYESKGLGEKLRERWRQKGELWLNPVISEPVRFSSSQPNLVESCRGAPASNNGMHPTALRVPLINVVSCDVACVVMSGSG